jgi:hypothetical protein
MDEGGALGDPGQAGRFLEQLVVEIHGRTHLAFLPVCIEYHQIMCVSMHERDDAVHLTWPNRRDLDSSRVP